MLRILHFAGIINRHDFIDSILTKLDRSRFEIAALTAAAPLRREPYADAEAYSTHSLSIPISRRTYGRLVAALVETIRRIRPDIVHAHHYDESFLASLAVRYTRSPALVIGHHYSDHIYYLSSGWRRRLHLMVEAFSNRAAARIVVPAQEVFRILVDRQREPADKVSVIPYGLPLERYRASAPDAAARLRREHGLDGRFVVLACCRLNREKGLEHLLRAVPALTARHPDAAVVLVGDGSYRPDLVRLAAELGIGRAVSFVGWRADALDWLAMSDVIVQPSMCESYCQVLVEALAFAKPVVMTPVGAGPEVIGDNERGRLVPKGDSLAIAAALDELASDRTLGPRLGGAGHAYVRAHMDVARIVQAHEAMYSRVAEEAHAGRRSRSVH